MYDNIMYYINYKIIINIIKSWDPPRLHPKLL